jgi:uncharacterized membrane protein YidH (DUF202 family)
MFRILAWMRFVLALALLAMGIDSYPVVPRNKVAHIGYEVHAEAIKHNLGTSNPDPLWLKIEDLGKSYISSQDEIDAEERRFSIVVSSIGIFLLLCGLVEIALARIAQRRAVKS